MIETDRKVPAIRFKGFTDDWELRKLNEFASYTSSSLSAKDALAIGAYDLYDANSLIGKTDFKCMDENYISIIKDGAGVGRIRLLPRKSMFIGTMGAITAKDCDLYFLYALLTKADLGKTYSGSTIPHIYFKDYGNELCNTPSYAEQKRLGLFLKEIDNFITLHQRKYETLKKLKKAMLRRMFPEDGDINPKVRFDKFRDDWEQRKFSDLVTIERGGSPRPISDFLTSDPNGLNWVKIGDAPEQGSYITSTSEKIKPEGLSKTREVHPGDLILSNSMSFGRPYIMAINGCIHDGWLLIRNDRNVFDLNFLCTLLGSDSMLNQYKALASGSAVNNLNKELVGSTNISYTSQKEEIKIGQFFSKLDNLITLHQRKYEQLQKLKKAFLKKMFV